MNFKISKAINHSLQPVRRALFNDRELARLAALDLPCAAALRDALQATLDERLAAGERQAIEAIEQLRSRLLADPETLQITDYGAGAPGEDRSEARMRRGVAEVATVADICRANSKRGVWSLLLFQLVRHCAPKRCLEMGTSLGLSCAYLAAALELNAGGGRIVTLEGSAPLAHRARGHLDALGLLNAEVRVGRFTDTLAPALQELAPIDLAFVDGHHEQSATLDYFERLTGNGSEPALLVFDDIRWNPGMFEAWRRIAADPRVRIAVDLYRLGVAVTGPQAGAKPPARFSVALG